MNRLVSKRMSNIYLKVTIEKFYKFEKSIFRSVSGELQLTQISLNVQNAT